MRINIITLIVLFGFITLEVFAQSYLPRVRHYTTKSGLSDNTIYCMHKDARGFLWLGTGYGLNRYNGNTFEWFLKENKGLSSNFIHHIYEDTAGYLWLITLKYDYILSEFEVQTISLFNIYTSEVTTLAEKFGTALPFELDDLNFIKNLPDRSLLFVTISGKCFKYRSETGFQSFQLEFNFRKILDIIPLSDKGFWMLIDVEWQPPLEALIKIDSTGKVLKRIERFKEELSYYVGQDEQQQYWFGLEIDVEDVPPVPLYALSESDFLTTNDLSNLNLSSQGITPPTRFRTIQIDPYQQLFWAKVNNEILVFHPEKGLLHLFENLPLNRDERLEMQVLFDKTVTWITDGKSGLSAFELQPNHFQQILSTDKISSPDVYSCRGITTDHLGRIWIGTYNHTQIVDLATPSVISLKPLEVDYPAITKDQQGNIWTRGEKALVCFKKPDYEPAFYPHPDLVGDFWSIYEDQRGIIWYANDQELYYFNPKTQKHHLFEQWNEFIDLAKAFTYFIGQCDEETLWLAGSEGLFVLDRKRGIIAQYNSQKTDKLYLPAMDIHHLHQDTRGILWLATSDNGLLRCKATKKDGTAALPTFDCQQFTIGNGLSSNSLHAVYEDDFEHLWLSSQHGIIQFNKNNFQAKSYLLEAGISDNEFNRISHYQDENGKIYFGTVNGVTAFHPKDFYEDVNQPYNAPLQIITYEQFLGDKDSIEDKTADLTLNNKITLQPDDRFFNLEVALLDYKNNENVQYAYLLEGLHADWRVTKDNQISLGELPYGRFVLRVKGHGGDGRYSAQELAIPIRVIAPIYWQWWFWVLAFLGSLIAIWGVVKWRTTRLQQQKMRLEQLIKERTQTISEQAAQLRQLDKVKSRFFANVSHELRTPLTLMLAPISSLLKQPSTKEQQESLLQIAQNNGRQLLRLVNEILDLTKLETAQLELNENPIQLYTLLSRLVANFESHAKQKQVGLTLDYQIPKQLMVHVDDDKLEKVVNNLLSNAIKFTLPKGKVELIVTSTVSKLQLQVQDTGQGIHPDDLPHVFNRFYQSKQSDAPIQGGTGIGLALCREYAHLFKGSIRVESEWGKGSVFIFEFPKKVAVSQDLNDSEAITDITHPLPVITNDSSIDKISSPSKATLLLVEDNLQLQAYLKYILEPLYQVKTALNGQEALNIIQTLQDSSSNNGTANATNIDLIISDVMMPVMDGFTFLQHLKSNATLLDFPVIMLTARAEKEDKLRALRIGVDDYLLKPFEEEELLARIENLLKNRAARRLFSQTEVIEPVDATSDTSSPSPPPLSQETQAWLEQLENAVQKGIQNFNFNTEALAQEMALSRRQLNRKIKKLTGLTTGEYIREIRLQTARYLLETRKYDSVKAVAYSVGWKTLDYFTKQFRERFGKNPSDYW